MTAPNAPSVQPPAHGKSDPEHVLADAYFRQAVAEAARNGEVPEAVSYDPLQVAVQDGLADLEAAGYRVVRNGEHLLHQGARRWSMEHTVDCRERGLTRCELGTLAVDDYFIELQPGTYRLTWPQGDKWPTAEAVPHGA